MLGVCVWSWIMCVVLLLKYVFLHKLKYSYNVKFLFNQLSLSCTTGRWKETHLHEYVITIGVSHGSVLGLIFTYHLSSVILSCHWNISKDDPKILFLYDFSTHSNSVSIVCSLRVKRSCVQILALPDPRC